MDLLAIRHCGKLKSVSFYGCDIDTGYCNNNNYYHAFSHNNYVPMINIAVKISTIVVIIFITQ